MHKRHIVPRPYLRDRSLELKLANNVATSAWGQFTSSHSVASRRGNCIWKITAGTPPTRAHLLVFTGGHICNLHPVPRLPSIAFSLK